MAGEHITREMIDDFRSGRERLLLRYQLMQELKERFPTPETFKKLSARELESLHQAISRSLDSVLLALPELINTSIEVINGMERELSRGPSPQG